jgi:hypothetical protein
MPIPKPEARRPKEIRIPKSEGGRPVGESLPRGRDSCSRLPKLNTQARGESRLDVWGENSDFGIRISFGLRVSVFGFHGCLAILSRAVTVPKHHTFVTPRR